ncbi:hypothetical protein [Lysinibacillus piscis]|uniref:Uncharacterized protein n=1 Tax=Lysinibacillus piscis TaxID=2518931 RepID=A0ABQ5NQC2_9BACI|nr:hypothetical protein [Lysinibacillus sp. KH24]GLC90550.1 hypothetical protein LYSBPC_36770 [Lysinibacillus sp. KH24]
MLKDEWKNEHELQQQLDRFDVPIPEKLATYKKNRWDRFITYLGAPAKDPFEQISSTSFGYTALRIVPLACAVILALVQLFSVAM